MAFSTSYVPPQGGQSTINMTKPVVRPLPVGPTIGQSPPIMALPPDPTGKNPGSVYPPTPGTISSDGPQATQATTNGPAGPGTMLNFENQDDPSKMEAIKNLAQNPDFQKQVLSGQGSGSAPSLGATLSPAVGQAGKLPPIPPRLAGMDETQARAQAYKNDANFRALTDAANGKGGQAGASGGFAGGPLGGSIFGGQGMKDKLRQIMTKPAMRPRPTLALPDETGQSGPVAAPLVANGAWGRLGPAGGGGQAQQGGVMGKRGYAR